MKEAAQGPDDGCVDLKFRVKEGSHSWTVGVLRAARKTRTNQEHGRCHLVFRRGAWRWESNPNFQETISLLGFR